LVEQELTIDQALHKAIEAHKSDELQEAVRLYRGILQEQPQHTDANHNLGVLAVAAGKPEIALPLFKIALEANLKQEQFWISYIDALIKTTQLETAREVLQQGKNNGLSGETINALEKQLSFSSPPHNQVNALIDLYHAGQMVETEKACLELLQTYPQALAVINILGAAFNAQGKLAEAVASYDQTIQLKPDNAEAYYNRGITLQALGRLTEAVASYDQAIQLKPDHVKAYCNRGVALQELGQLTEAVASYDQAIQLKPDYLGAYYNRGVTLQAQGKLAEAVTSYDQTIQLKPDYADAYYNRGVTLQALGQLAEAMTSYDQTIHLKPDYADAYYNRGITLQELGRLAEAMASYDQTIQLKPDYVAAYYNRATTFQALGQLAEVVACYDQVIQLKPDYAEAHNGRATALKELGQLTEAVVSYDQAIQLKPDYAEAYSNRGNTLQELGQLTEAMVSHDQAIQLKPDYAEAYNNRGNALKAQGKLAEAVVSYDQAILLKPDYAEAYSNRGNALKELGQLAEAVVSHDQAIQLEPDNAEAYYNRGITLQKLFQLDAAVSSYERALAIKPDYHVARYNLSLIQLSNGFLSEGFKNHEARWQWTKFPSARRQFSIPRWTGEPLAGKNILLWGEQGIGDELMFASIIPEFEKLDCNVGIECAAKLVEIFQWSFPWAEVRETGAVNCEGNEVYGLFDYQIPFGSLAPIFRKTLDDFRNFQKPFIPRLKKGEEKVRNKLNLQEGQLLIGVCWRSSLQTIERSIHYLSVEALAPLKAIKGAVFLGIQYDDCMPELDRVRELGLPINYYTDIDQKNDLASTSALIGACDLVISAATAVCSMSGALGVPTIVFESGKSQKNNIPWLPTIRYFPLNPDDPSLLINNIINQMPELINWSNKVTTSGRYMDALTAQKKFIQKL